MSFRAYEDQLLSTHAITEVTTHENFTNLQRYSSTIDPITEAIEVTASEQQDTSSDCHVGPRSKVTPTAGIT